MFEYTVFDFFAGGGGCGAGYKRTGAYVMGCDITPQPKNPHDFIQADWQEVTSVSNETLVNALSMMSPYQARDKQALLEATDLKSRAEVLVALTTMAMASHGAGEDGRLQ